MRQSESSINRKRRITAMNLRGTFMASRNGEPASSIEESKRKSMSTIRESRQPKRACAIVILAAVFCAGLWPVAGWAQSAVAPILATDKPDYSPGEYVTFTGAGWQPGETVRIEVYESSVDPFFDEGGVSAIADANGNITNSDLLVHRSFLNEGFLATAIGQDPAETASTTFTDSSQKV